MDDDTEPGTARTEPTGGAPTDQAAPARPPATRWRRRLVTSLAVLACIGMLASVIAVWSHRTLLNTDQWVETVAPLAEDPAITDAVATQLTALAVEVVNPEELARKALPDKAQFLAAPLSDAVQGFVLDQTKALLQTEQFRTLWAELNRRVHQNVVAFLRGEPVAGLSADNGTVTLNLLPLLSRLLQWIDDKAPDLIDKPIPVITPDTPPDQARAELSALLGRPLPAGFGTYTVLHSDDLAAAQRAVVLFDRLVIAIVALTVVLAVAALVLSDRRRRTLLVLSIGLVTAMLLADAVVNATQRVVLGLIGNSETRDAAAATITTLVSQLRFITNVLFWVGLVVVVAAFLTGESRPALALRRLTGRAAGAGMAAGRSLKGDDTGAEWVVRHRGALAVAGLAVALVVLWAIDVTFGSLLVIVGLTVVYEAGLALLAGDRPAVGADPGAA